MTLTRCWKWRLARFHRQCCAWKKGSFAARLHPLLPCSHPTNATRMRNRLLGRTRPQPTCCPRTGHGAFYSLLTRWRSGCQWWGLTSHFREAAGEIPWRDAFLPKRDHLPGEMWLDGAQQPSCSSPRTVREAVPRMETLDHCAVCGFLRLSRTVSVS